jgi:hypothetical protein
MMMARASGLAPFSHSLTQMAKVSVSRAVFKSLLISARVLKVFLVSTILLPLPLPAALSPMVGTHSGIIISETEN